MVKLSDVVKEIEDRIKEDGDLYVRCYEISDERMTSSYWVNSETRKNKNGTKAKMSIAEFRKYVKDFKKGNDYV